MTQPGSMDSKTLFIDCWTRSELRTDGQDIVAWTDHIIPVSRVSNRCTEVQVYFPTGISLGQFTRPHMADASTLAAQTLVTEYLW